MREIRQSGSEGGEAVPLAALIMQPQCRYRWPGQGNRLVSPALLTQPRL